MSHDEGMNTLTGRTRKQEVSAKLAGYAEGVVHGWEDAARSVSEVTNGLFTLQEPANITAYRERLKRYKKGCRPMSDVNQTVLDMVAKFESDCAGRGHYFAPTGVLGIDYCLACGLQRARPTERITDGEES